MGDWRVTSSSMQAVKTGDRPAVGQACEWPYDAHSPIVLLVKNGKSNKARGACVARRRHEHPCQIFLWVTSPSKKSRKTVKACPHYEECSPRVSSHYRYEQPWNKLIQRMKPLANRGFCRDHSTFTSGKLHSSFPNATEKFQNVYEGMYSLYTNFCGRTMAPRCKIILCPTGGSCPTAGPDTVLRSRL